MFPEPIGEPLWHKLLSHFGGWTIGPVQCDPFTLACRGVVPAG
jgi:hypothetical protein